MTHAMGTEEAGLTLKTASIPTLAALREQKNKIFYTPGLTR
jgi:hypothetical protein